MSDLLQRYGAPSRARRPLVVGVAVLLAVVGVCWLAWTMLFHTRPQVRSQLVSFHVVSEHAAEARFTVVRRSAEVAASCLLRASAADHSVVGELSFSVDSSSPARVTLERSLRTERRATTVDLVGCTAEGQKQRR